MSCGKAKRIAEPAARHRLRGVTSQLQLLDHATRDDLRVYLERLQRYGRYRRGGKKNCIIGQAFFYTCAKVVQLLIGQLVVVAYATFCFCCHNYFGFYACGKQAVK